MAVYAEETESTRTRYGNSGRNASRSERTRADITTDPPLALQRLG